MPGSNTIAGPREWACSDCYVMFVNGDPPADRDQADLDAWWQDYTEGSRGQDITAGMTAEYHECRDAAGQTASERGGECECETRTFSTDQCAICRTTLGGYRHAVTFWYPPNDTRVSGWFDYVPTRHTDRTVDYGVWHGGAAPLNALGTPGRYIGRVHKRHNTQPPGYNNAGNYWATPDDGNHNWAQLHWYGPFRTRVAAAQWLTGYHAGRNQT